MSQLLRTRAKLGRRQFRWLSQLEVGRLSTDIIGVNARCQWPWWNNLRASIITSFGYQRWWRRLTHVFASFNFLICSQRSFFHSSTVATLDLPMVVILHLCSQESVLSWQEVYSINEQYRYRLRIYICTIV